MTFRVFAADSLASPDETDASGMVRETETKEIHADKTSWLNILEGGYFGWFKETYTEMEFKCFLLISQNENTFSITLYDLGTALKRADETKIFSLYKATVYQIDKLSIAKANEILDQKTGMHNGEEGRGFQLVERNYLSLHEEGGKSATVFQFKLRNNKLSGFRIQEIRLRDVSRCYESIGRIDKGEKNTDWKF